MESQDFDQLIDEAIADHLDEMLGRVREGVALRPQNLWGTHAELRIPDALGAVCYTVPKLDRGLLREVRDPQGTAGIASALAWLACAYAIEDKIRDRRR
jgi:hypothetical protein